MDLHVFLEKRLNSKILRISKLYGGDINEAFVLTLKSQKLVVKINKSALYPDMFLREKEGLQLLNNAGVHTPKVVLCFSEKEHQYLVMDLVETGGPKTGFWENFGVALAKLHQNTSTCFGLQDNNYIGSLVQGNGFKVGWIDFFIEKRLDPLVKLALDNRLLKVDHLKKFNELYKKLPDLIPHESPALLHGDLWSGNLLVGADQNPYFIDPAVYFGHREMDLAMTILFGGFDSSYLDAYQSVFPLEKGWRSRLEIHNLYPKLVHLNLFGRSYLRGIEQVIQEYSA